MPALKDLRRGNTKKRRRSSGWRRVRRRHLKANPSCAVCGSQRSLEVHHIQPFHQRPDLELEPSNLLTLCDSLAKRGLNCHHLYGHLRNWRIANPTVTFDAEVWRMKLRGLM